MLLPSIITLVPVLSEGTFASLWMTVGRPDRKAGWPYKMGRELNTIHSTEYTLDIAIATLFFYELVVWLPRLVFNVSGE